LLNGGESHPQRVKIGSRQGPTGLSPEYAMVARELMGGAADVMAGLVENEVLEMNELARDWRIDRGNAAVGKAAGAASRIPKARQA